MSYDLFADSEPSTIARKSDPETSKLAAAIAPTGKTREFILKEVTNAGKNGVTLKEICHTHSLQMSSYSSRPSELEKESAIFYDGTRRDGARVMKAKSFDRGTRHHSCGMVLLEFYNYKCHRCNDL